MREILLLGYYFEKFTNESFLMFTSNPLLQMAFIRIIKLLSNYLQRTRALNRCFPVHILICSRHLLFFIENLWAVQESPVVFSKLQMEMAWFLYLLFSLYKQKFPSRLLFSIYKISPYLPLFPPSPPCPHLPVFQYL